MIQRQDFHVFARGDQHYLFLAQPVALFKVDAETGAALQQLEAGESVALGAAGERAREAAAFMDDYCRKAPPARKLRAPGDISDKVWGLYASSGRGAAACFFPPITWKRRNACAIVWPWCGKGGWLPAIRPLPCVRPRAVPIWRKCSSGW